MDKFNQEFPVRTSDTSNDNLQIVGLMTLLLFAFVARLRFVSSQGAYQFLLYIFDFFFIVSFVCLIAKLTEKWMSSWLRKLRSIYANYFDFWGHWKLQEDFFKRLKDESARRHVDRSSLDDLKLCEELINKSFDENYVEILENRQKLPSFHTKSDILTAIRDNQVVLVEGNTGCGKTTQVRISQSLHVKEKKFKI